MTDFSNQVRKKSFIPGIHFMTCDRQFYQITCYFSRIVYFVDFVESFHN